MNAVEMIYRLLNREQGCNRARLKLKLEIWVQTLLSLSLSLQAVIVLRSQIHLIADRIARSPVLRNSD